MELDLASLILDIASGLLRDRRDVVWMAVRQRASFTGWLKLEMAYALELYGFPSVMMDYPYAGGRKADISFELEEGGRCFLELRTCRTNWAAAGVLPSRKTMTKGVRGLLSDLEAVKNVAEPDLGLALVVLFPVPARESWRVEEKIRAWKHGPALLAEDPLRNVVAIVAGVDAAILVFGPYQSGELVARRLAEVAEARPMERVGGTWWKRTR